MFFSSLVIYKLNGISITERLVNFRVLKFCQSKNMITKNQNGIFQIKAHNKIRKVNKLDFINYYTMRMLIDRAYLIVKNRLIKFRFKS